MLSAGRQEDMLARETTPCEIEKQNGNDPETQKQLEKIIEETMTELVADLDEDNRLTGDVVAQSDNTPFSLTPLRGLGDDNCGYNFIASPTTDPNSCVYEVVPTVIDVPDAPSNNTSRTTEPPNKTHMTRERLTTLSLKIYDRRVAHVKGLEYILVNGSYESIQDWAILSFTDKKTGILDETQKRAFEVIISKFILTFIDEADDNVGKHAIGTQLPHRRIPYNALRRNLRRLSGMKAPDSPLVMFLTGAGGSGKSQVINAIRAYAKKFCVELKHPFTRRTIVVTALTGVAATSINGETLASATHIMKKHITGDHISEWTDTRLLIVDEVSFATAQELINLDKTLRKLKQNLYGRYGGLNVIFAGDFSQLEPVKGEALYFNDSFSQWHDWINSFWELTGQHRFKDDPEFGRVMQRLRDGHPTARDIDYINQRVLNGFDPACPTDADLPSDLSYAVYANKNRCAINNGIFCDHVAATHYGDKTREPPGHTLIVRSDDLTWANSKKRWNRGAEYTLWTQCHDDHVQTTGKQPKRVDPFLKLYEGVAMMYTENDDVINGEANGTLCFLHKVHLKPNVTNENFRLMNFDGYWVRTIGISEIDYIEARFADSERTFKLYSNKVTCSIKMPITLIPGMEPIWMDVRAKLNRFSVLINHATTGHKLQGQTKANLLIAEWFYGSNWPYVVLSRVTTHAGLFLKTAIRRGYEFTNDSRLTRMLNRFRTTKQPIPFDEMP